ncbi:MAG: hypothetical protein PHD37_10760 [Gallionellaceae bacterium]|nr:hypothetical protein [Gallionellaceae bacterium]
MATLNLDKMSVEELLELAKQAQQRANQTIQDKKNEGLEIIKKTIVDYHINNYDLSQAGIIPAQGTAKTVMTKDDAHYEIDGKFWKPSIGKTPFFVIEFLKKGGNLAGVIIDNRITAQQANTEEQKVRASKSFTNS